jgi:hypothetical protein
MIKAKLIEDLKKVVESEPDEIDKYGDKYYSFSEQELKGIINVLENQ